MKVFLTGATGFVGFAVLRQLLASGQEVKALIRQDSRVEYLKGMDVEVCHGDIRDLEGLRRVMKGCDRAYHVAALYSLKGSWEEFENVNVQGTLNVLRAAAELDYERVVYTSTVAAVGSAPAGELADEETEWNLGDLAIPYVQTKRKAEVEAFAFAQDKLDLVVVNPSGPIGPWDVKPTPTGALVLGVLRGRMPFVPAATNNFVSVNSVAKGHLLAMEKGRAGERYILADVNTTLKAFADLVADLAGLRKPWKLPYLLAWLGGLFGQVFVQGLLRRPCTANLANVRFLRRRMAFSSDKAKNELGWNPEPLEDAVTTAIRWYCERGYVRKRRAKRILAALERGV